MQAYQEADHQNERVNPKLDLTGLRGEHWYERAFSALGRILIYLIGTLSAFVSPFPWSIPFFHHVLPCCLGRGEPRPSDKIGLAKTLCFAFGHTINSALLLIYLRATSAVTRFYAWEAALLGWSLSMTSLQVYDAVQKYRGGTFADTCKMLLLPFGIAAPKEVGDTFMWSFALVSLIVGQAFWFMAENFLYHTPKLLCDVHPVVVSNLTSTNLTASESCPSPLIASGLSTIGRCCRVVDASFEPSHFLASLGGNIITGYGVINRIGTFLVWSDPSRLKDSNHSLKSLKSIIERTSGVQRGLDDDLKQQSRDLASVKRRLSHVALIMRHGMNLKTDQKDLAGDTDAEDAQGV